MTDFLEELERELAAAAQRRSAESPDHARRSGSGWLADLRAIGSGAMMAASVGVVAVVVAVLAASGIHRPTARRAPAAGGAPALSGVRRGCGGPGAGFRTVDSAGGAGLRELLRVGRRATGRERRVALRALDQASSGARAVYVRDIRVLHLPGGVRVTLLGVQSCMTDGRPWAPRAASAPRPSVVAEISSVHGLATILLGSVGQIRSGAAFRARTVLLIRPGGLESITMVPAGVVRIICPGATHGAAQQQFPVVDHLAVLPATAVDSDCHLSDRRAWGSHA